MQTTLCIMDSERLYEMQLLSFLLACNLAATYFKPSATEHSRMDAYAAYIKNLPCPHYKIHQMLGGVSNVSELAGATAWLRDTTECPSGNERKGECVYVCVYCV